MQVFTMRYKIKSHFFALTTKCQNFSQYSDILATEFGLVARNTADFQEFAKNLLIAFNYGVTTEEKQSFRRQLSKHSLFSLRGEFQEMYHMLNSNFENFTFNKALATHHCLEKEVIKVIS